MDDDEEDTVERSKRARVVVVVGEPGMNEWMGTNEVTRAQTNKQTYVRTAVFFIVCSLL